jgi:anti-sigma B factor antagonist
LDISQLQQSGRTILRLHGDLRRGDPTDDLKNTLDDLIAQGNFNIILNISDVNMIDSTGIGIIVRGHTRTIERGGALKLVNPSKFALQTLKIVGLLNVLTVVSNEEDAIASFA